MKPEEEAGRSDGRCWTSLLLARASEIDGKEYAISHRWGDSVPVHLLGARVPIDRRSPGVPGAAKSSPHGLVQEYLNRSDDHLWALLTNGAFASLSRTSRSLDAPSLIKCRSSNVLKSV